MYQYFINQIKHIHLNKSLLAKPNKCAMFWQPCQKMINVLAALSMTLNLNNGDGIRRSHKQRERGKMIQGERGKMIQGERGKMIYVKAQLISASEDWGKGGVWGGMMG